MERSWYKAIVPTAHRGPKSSETHPVYLQAKDTQEAMDMLFKVRGWNRSRRIPSISEMNDEQVRRLRTAMEERGIKARVVYGQRPDGSRIEI